MFKVIYHASVLSYLAVTVSLSYGLYSMSWESMNAVLNCILYYFLSNFILISILYIRNWPVDRFKNKDVIQDEIQWDRK